jgi:hypothetical protein
MFNLKVLSHNWPKLKGSYGVLIFYQNLLTSISLILATKHPTNSMDINLLIFF